MIITVSPKNFENRGPVPEHEIKELFLEIARTSRERYHRYYLKGAQVEWVLNKFSVNRSEAQKSIEIYQKKLQRKKS